MRGGTSNGSVRVTRRRAGAWRGGTLVGAVVLGVAGCSSTARSIGHPVGAGDVVIELRHDDRPTGADPVIGGPEVVVYGDGAVVLRRFASDNIPRRARLDEATVQRLLAAAEHAGLLAPAAAGEAGVPSAAPATELDLVTAAGVYRHRTFEPGSNTPARGQALLVAFLVQLRDTVVSTTGAPLAVTGWLVVDSAIVPRCRIVAGAARPPATLVRALFPGEQAQPLGRLSAFC